MPFGANKPIHRDPENLGIFSEIEGTSGSMGERLGELTPRAFKF